MKSLRIITTVFFLLSLLCIRKTSASEPLKDYSFIRGACYPGGWSGDQKIIERDMGYAKKLQLNSIRIWLSYTRYLQDPKGYIEKLRNYVRTANSFGITTMPILFNGNSLNPETLTKEFREKTGDIHGLVYPDGTIRDPAIIAALFGFYRNRDLKTSIKANPNKEGHVEKALTMLEKALKDETTVFRNRRTSTDDILEAAEYCANLLAARSCRNGSDVRTSDSQDTDMESNAC